MPESNAPSVLWVSSLEDQSARDVRDALSVGLQTFVQSAPDVYAAMARLVQDSAIRAVLVDVRGLDDREMAFLRLAPRYFPALELHVPALDGAEARLRSYPISLLPRDTDWIIRRLSGSSAFSLQENAGPDALDLDTTAEDTPPAPVAAPDQGRPDTAPAAQEAPAIPDQAPPESVPEGDRRPLHEAVRNRMAADDPRGVSRTPPRRMPPGSPRPQQPDRTRPNGAGLTSDEVEALIGPSAEAEPDDADDALPDQDPGHPAPETTPDEEDMGT